jgi:hypothetical protein
MRQAINNLSRKQCLMCLDIKLHEKMLRRVYGLRWDSGHDVFIRRLNSNSRRRWWNAILCCVALSTCTARHAVVSVGLPASDIGPRLQFSPLCLPTSISEVTTSSDMFHFQHTTTTKPSSLAMLRVDNATLFDRMCGL